MTKIKYTSTAIGADDDVDIRTQITNQFIPKTENLYAET